MLDSKISPCTMPNMVGGRISSPRTNHNHTEYSVGVSGCRGVGVHLIQYSTYESSYIPIQHTIITIDDISKTFIAIGKSLLF